MNDPASVLEKILADPEFRTDWREDLGKRLLDVLRQVLAWLDHLSGPARLAVLLVCLAFLAGIVWSILLGYRKAAAPEQSVETANPPIPAVTPASQLATRARDLASRGCYREAARTLQQAVYRTLSDRAGMPWDEARADWEWVARFGAVAGLVGFTEDAQRLAYGASPGGASQATLEANGAGRFALLWSTAGGWFDP